MANNGWGHALAAAVGGYMAGQKMVDDKAANDDDKAWKQLQRERQSKEWAEADTLKADLKAAGQPMALTQGAGDMVRPESMDNRDVGLPENAAVSNGGLLPAGYRVADQAFTDKPAAEAAVAKHNAPEAVNDRIVAAYRGAGQHDKATQVEGNGRAAEMQKIQLADARWKRDLGAAMRGGHAGLATLATNSEAGPMAGMKVQVVPTADGKITYGAADKDGNVTPIPGLPSFTNDQDGITRAAWMLDQSITPEMRMAHLTANEVRAQKKSDDDRNYNLKSREVDSKIELRGAQAENMALRASIAAGKAGAGKTSGAEPFDALKDFDSKQARKGAMDQAIEEAKNSGKTVTETEIAKRAQGIYSALRDAAASENTNRHAQAAVASAFRQAGSDPAAYAETYSKAQQVANPQQLAAWGFKAPGAAAAKPGNPVPASAQSAVAKAPPVQGSAQGPMSPADMAGARVDQARATLAALRSKPAPGMAAGREAIDSYAANVQSARGALAQAEADYQRAAPNSGAAFVSPSM